VLKHIGNMFTTISHTWLAVLIVLFAIIYKLYDLESIMQEQTVDIVHAEQNIETLNLRIDMLETKIRNMQ
jgi:hypothetical protein